MRHVAFFRNLNLGQRRSNSPTTPELLGAFAAAGASEAVNVQSNGTVIFSGAQPTWLVRDVVRRLGGVCGFRDAVIVRPAGWVRQLVAGLADMDATGVEVVLFDAREPLPIEAGWTEPTAGLLTVRRIDARHAITYWMLGGAGSTANPVLTGLLGVPVTSRGLPTMRRLAGRLAR